MNQPEDDRILPAVRWFMCYQIKPGPEEYHHHGQPILKFAEVSNPLQTFDVLKDLVGEAYVELWIYYTSVHRLRGPELYDRLISLMTRPDCCAEMDVDRDGGGSMYNVANEILAQICDEIMGPLHERF